MADVSKFVLGNTTINVKDLLLELTKVIYLR